MADIRTYPLLRHLRSEPTMHPLHYRRGVLARSGRGLAFWFRPLAAAIAEVPLDDRDLPFLFHGRSSDFQDVTVQGTVTYRLTDPVLVAERIDFTVDLRTGQWTKTPLEQIAGLLTQLAQQFVRDYLTSTTLEILVKEGVSEVRERIGRGLRGELALNDLGIAVVAVRVAAIQPEPDIERALQTPTRESIQQDADEATFERRALAVEKERAIAENELQNKIELAKREQTLVTQEGQNERTRSEEAAAARKIEATAAADTSRLDAEVQAERIERVEGARAGAERERTAIYSALPPAVLLGLSARELAGKLERIEHLNVTPEMLTPLLTTLAGAGAKVLEDRAA